LHRNKADRRPEPKDGAAELVCSCVDGKADGLLLFCQSENATPPWLM
jgi:hypothetical protein